MNEPQHWAQAYAATADPAHACLPPDELLAALAGELAGERAERALAALAECPRCAAVAQIARDLQAHVTVDDAASSTVLGSGKAAAPRPVLRFVRWATAAVIVLGVGTATLVLREPVTPPVVRGDAATALEPRSGAQLPAAPPRLRWNAIGTAAAYRVELYDERAESLWRSERVTATSLELPADLRARLGRGTYLWRVRAEGSEIDIGPFYFRIEP